MEFKDNVIYIDKEHAQQLYEDGYAVDVMYDGWVRCLGSAPISCGVTKFRVGAEWLDATGSEQFKGKYYEPYVYVPKYIEKYPLDGVCIVDTTHKNSHSSTKYLGEFSKGRIGGYRYIITEHMINKGTYRESYIDFEGCTTEPKAPAKPKLLVGARTLPTESSNYSNIIRVVTKVDDINIKFQGLQGWYKAQDFEHTSHDVPQTIQHHFELVDDRKLDNQILVGSTPFNNVLKDKYYIQVDNDVLYSMLNSEVPYNLDFKQEGRYKVLSMSSGSKVKSVDDFITELNKIIQAD